MEVLMWFSRLVNVFVIFLICHIWGEYKYEIGRRDEKLANQQPEQFKPKSGYNILAD